MLSKNYILNSLNSYEFFENCQNYFLKIVHTFRKISLCYEKLIKKFSLNSESGAGVKLIFENREFSCFSMGVRISKIHNSKTIRDKKFLIFTSNWVFSSYLMSWYQNFKNPKFLKQYIVLYLTHIYSPRIWGVFAKTYLFERCCHWRQFWTYKRYKRYKRLLPSQHWKHCFIQLTKILLIINMNDICF